MLLQQTFVDPEVNLALELFLRSEKGDRGGVYRQRMDRAAIR
jgi:hypothetical protein